MRYICKLADACAVRSASNTYRPPAFSWAEHYCACMHTCSTRDLHARLWTMCYTWEAASALADIPVSVCACVSLCCSGCALAIQRDACCRCSAYQPCVLCIMHGCHAVHAWTFRALHAARRAGVAAALASVQILLSKLACLLRISISEVRIAVGWIIRFREEVLASVWIL